MPLGNVMTRVTNERGYPVDLSYPASVGSRCGEYGKCVSLQATSDWWVQLGALLSPGSHKMLLPGSNQAAAIIPDPAWEDRHVRHRL